MPNWVIGVLEWGLSIFLQHISAADVKTVVADLFEGLDNTVQAADSRLSGPFKGVADEVAVAFHEAVLVIVAALRK